MFHSENREGREGCPVKLLFQRRADIFLKNLQTVHQDDLGAHLCVPVLSFSFPPRLVIKIVTIKLRLPVADT